jgi:hypothetical protein
MKIVDFFKKLNRRFEVEKKDITEPVEVEHKHDDGTTHSHVDGDKKHTHEFEKLNKDEFMTSNGFSARPNSHKAITAWEEYKES